MEFHVSVSLDDRDPDYSWLNEACLKGLQKWPLQTIPDIGEQLSFRGPREVDCVVINREWMFWSLGLMCEIKVWTRRFYEEQVARGWKPSAWEREREQLARERASERDER
jgi:hypothetical protein